MHEFYINYGNHNTCDVEMWDAALKVILNLLTSKVLEAF